MTAKKDQPTLFEIETAPRFKGDVKPSDVFAKWIDRAEAASVVNPRKDGEPHRVIRIPELEFQCLRRLMAEEPKE